MAEARETVMTKDDRPLFDREAQVVLTIVWVISVLRVAVALTHREYLGAEVAIACLFVLAGVVLRLRRLSFPRRRR
ncbi:MAG: hypothetical protein JWM74_3498 [Myxococcaceae bacterium]|nr:hypothetical protein [Myxococcaceae bacterium]